VKQPFEPRELVGVGEDDPGDACAVRRAEALLQRCANLCVAADQPVDDFIAREDARSEALERS
jgi:hypothetical protein